MDIHIEEKKLLKPFGGWFFALLAAITAALIVSFLIRLTPYEITFFLLIFILSISILLFGNSIIFAFILLLSIVSRGVLNIAWDITLFDVLLIFLSSSVIIKWLFLRKSFNISKVGYWFIVFFCIIVLTEIIGLVRFPKLFYVASLKPFLQFIEYILVFVCVVNVVKTRQDIKKYVNVEIYCGILLAAVIIYEAHYGVFLFGEQPIFGSAYSDYSKTLKINPASMILLIPTFWLIVFYPKKRLYMYILIPLFLFVFILSSSRSLYIAVLGGIVGMLYLRNISKVVLVLLICIVITWFNIDFLSPKVSEISNSIFFYFKDPYSLDRTSTAGRLSLWQTTMPYMLLKHPFWGYGINGFGMEIYSQSNFKNLYGELNYFEWFNVPDNPSGDAHNQYLQILADHGIVAFVLFVYLYFKVIKVCCNNYRETNDPFLKSTSQALFVSLISFSFAFIGITLLETDNNIMPVVFWFNIGILYSMKRVIEKNGNKGIK